MATTEQTALAPPVGSTDTRQPQVLPLVDAIPRLSAFGLVALGLVGTPLLLLGQFRPLPVVLGAGALLVGLELAWRRTAGAAGARVTRRTAVVSLLAVLVAAVSTAVNARYGSQHLLVDGDPAIYAVTGQLIAETGSREILTRAQDVFGGVASLNFAGAGFDTDASREVVRPSFMHLLPQVLAVAAWVGGAQALLWANAVVAGAALLAVFAFGARLLGRPEWSLVAMTALALSLPQQHFSRDTFSELPAQLLVFAGLALLFDAVRRRPREGHGAGPGGGLVHGLLAGLVLGVSCLARIDAFFYLVPLLMVVAVLTLTGARRLATGVTAGVAVGAVLGYVDLRVASPSYLGLQSDNLNMIFAALAATAVVCALALAFRGRALSLWERLHGRGLALGVAGVIAVLSAYAGLVRPLVETGRNLSPQQPTAVASLQEQAGLAIDPLRSYDERSLEWLSWYFGPAAIVLGLVGLVVLVHRVLVRHRTPEQANLALASLAFLLLFGATTALYVWRPSIIPVHYWATRRFLPVTIPGLLLCAAWLAAALPRPSRTRAGARGLRAAARAGVGAALLVPPLVFLPGHATEREYVPMLAVTEQVCAALRPDDAVLLVGGPRLSTGLPQTIHAFCGVPVAVISGATTLEDITAAAQSAQAAGKRLVVLSPIPDPALPDGPVPAAFSKIVDLQVSVVALSLTGRPDEDFSFPMTVFRGVVEVA